MNPNIVVNQWDFPYSQKVSLLMVNAVDYIVTFHGNHLIKMKLNERYQSLKNDGLDISLNMCPLIHPFHLKYVDYRILEKKLKTTKNQQIANLEQTYENMLNASYSISQYFATDALYCELNNKYKTITFLD